jgi:hypothetical protein
VGVLVAVVVAVRFVVVAPRSHQPAPSALPLRISGEPALPGDNSRLDYGLDADRGLLFIAHPALLEASTHCLEALRCRPRFSYCCCARAACSSEAFTTCTWSLICR